MSAPAMELESSDGKTRVYGIWTLDSPLVCHQDVLGETFAIEVGGVGGQLHMPSSPLELESLSDPLRVPLIPPPDATTWKHGTEPIPWGRRFASWYPHGGPQIDRALFTIDIDTNRFVEAGLAVRKDFNRWKTQFGDVLALLSKQCLFEPVVELLDRGPLGLDLFAWSPHRKQARPDRDGIFTSSSRVISFADAPIPDLAQIRAACTMASSTRQLPEAYQFQVEAYRAFKRRDLRKAIIESAVATEIALTHLIERRLLTDGVSYREPILKRFSMLSGRIELAKSMGFALASNLKETLVAPRNRVVHRGHEPDALEARKVIAATDGILEAHMPLGES